MRTDQPSPADYGPTLPSEAALAVRINTYIALSAARIPG